MPSRSAENEGSRFAQVPSRSDTTRSWRAMRLVFCLLCALISAAITFDDAYETAKWRAVEAQRAVANASGLYGKPYEDLYYAPVAVPVNDYVERGIGLALLAGIGGWIGAWLLILIVAFIWWFILDRIREFARAIKGQP